MWRDKLIDKTSLYRVAILYVVGVLPIIYIFHYIKQ